MPKRNPEKAIQMLDMLLEFFGEDGLRWTRGEFNNEDGQRCILGAMAHLRAVMNIRGDTAGYYLKKAAYPHPDPFFRHVWIAHYNDGFEEYAQLRPWIIEARALAQADLDEQRDRQRGNARLGCDSAPVQIEGEELR